MMPRALGRHGFALLLVLSVLVLLSAIALHLAATGRTEARIAYNLVAGAEAEAVADAGVARAVLALMERGGAESLTIGGAPQRLALPGGSAVVRIEDENAKVNPNLAPDWLLSALLQAAGVDDEQAQQLAAAIVEYRSVRTNAPPPSGTIETIDELLRVPGMTPAILAELRPVLSIHSGASVPDAHGARPLVATALASAAANPASTPGAFNPALALGERPTVAITVTAQSERGATFVRRAVVAIDPGNAAGYDVLAWERGELPER